MSILEFLKTGEDPWERSDGIKFKPDDINKSPYKKYKLNC
jgi:hypothetical protein